MRTGDTLAYAYGSIRAHPLRTSLVLLAMMIGVAAVLMLSTVGETARRYVTGEFAALGTNLLIVLPGRNETTGGQPPLLGTTPRDLTLDDAAALLRSQRVERIAPITVGSAPVSWQGREREVNVLGTTRDFLTVRHLEMQSGKFLADIPADRSLPVCVLGKTVQKELFGRSQALGAWVRVGEYRLRVVGILADQGQSLGLDMNDVVIIPVATAQSLFDAPSLFRILVQARDRGSIAAASEDIRRIIRLRHDNEDDVTIITQDSLVHTFDRILNTLTLAVSGIGAISLLVAGVLIMNVMLVTVSQRTAEVGLLKALGASARDVEHGFLWEAALLSGLGTGLGLALGMLVARGVARTYPAIPVHTPWWAIIAAIAIGLTTGMLFGIIPARRAARMDPVMALSRR